MAINFLIALATALASATLILLVLYVVLKVFTPNAFNEMIPVDQVTVESRMSQSQDAVGEQASRLPGPTEISPPNEPTASDLATEETGSHSDFSEDDFEVGIVRKLPRSEDATSRRVAPVQASPFFTDLSSVPLFKGLSPADRREILSKAHEKQFARRQTIFLEGDPVRRVVLLTSGGAKIVQLGQSGTETILGVHGPGEVVGTVGLRPQDRHTSTAMALAPSTALDWDAAAFETLSRRSVHLKRNIDHILLQQLRELEERYREMSTEKVSVRLSHQLVRLLNQLGRRVHGRLEIKFSREELAQMTGATLFTVSRLLSDWNQRGIVIASREAVSVSNFQALAELGEIESVTGPQETVDAPLPPQADSYRAALAAADLSSEIEELKEELGAK